MQWRKRGKIFDPTEHALPHGCLEFSQAPQALVLDDRVRIYFSSRQLESGTGKYLSHVVYADMTKDFRRLLDVSRHQVISLGKLGTFDEHGIFPMNVLRHGGRIYGFTSGVNRRASVPVDGAIGLAYSDDEGRTFHRAGDGPVLAPSLHEPCIVVDPFVTHAEGRFHMWYVFGLGWKESQDTVSPSRIYKIGHAVSGRRQANPPRLPGRRRMPSAAYSGSHWRQLPHVLLLPLRVRLSNQSRTCIQNGTCALEGPHSLDTRRQHTRAPTHAWRMGLRHALLPACI
jgi:hypothetical protein